jgi:hypothetical protein
MSQLRRSLAAAVLSTALVAVQTSGQTPVPTPAASIGQPSLWEQRVGSLVTLHGNEGAWSTLGYGVHRALGNPLVGLYGATGELYTALGKTSVGLRLMGEAQALGLSAGVDWRSDQGGLTPVVTFRAAMRRGGVIGSGSMLRFDWLPRRSQTFSAGLSVPVFRPLVGRTRPRKTDVRLAAIVAAERAPVRVSASAQSGTANLRSAASLIAAFSNAYSARAERVIVSGGGSYARALESYDRALRSLFAETGADSSLAARLIDRARATLLDRFLMPYDSLFGQVKSDASDLSPLTAAAANVFARWLRDSITDTGLRDRALTAFASWTSVIESVQHELLADAGDSRLAWLPLDLAITLDQFDEQSEVDSLIARAVGHPFSDRNALTYLRSDDLPLEIARSIYAAKEYHVLWTHDFTGRKESGAIDNVGYSMVADAYLPALTAAVKRYDSTGVLPTYIILQDEFFYEPRDNRLWMNILEDPLHASMRLQGDGGEREAHLRSRQEELRAAVTASSRLHRDAVASGNTDRWLRDVVKVHVNIVHPYDYSFRSSRIIPGLPFIPDNIMRDHRKLVFYDLNEADPYRGALLLMGVGVGEHYASATWEDRGYRVRGPATLEARRAVREALERNGLPISKMPSALRAVASQRAVEHLTNTGDYVGRALQVHNQVGFGRKESSVARAMLYNLAPPGSVILVPDPMWLSDGWAGMLAAAAARGCRVYVIAPGVENAPSPQPPLMAVQHRVLARLLALRSTLAGAIRASSGDLRVGIFAARAPVNDAVGRAKEVREGLARAPWIRDLVPFEPRTLAVLEGAESQAANGEDATKLASDDKPRAPQLHQKSQLVARPGAIAALVRQPGWDVVLAREIRVQSQETARFAEQLGYSEPNVDTAATRNTDALLRGYEQSLPETERQRVSFYFSLGTQNQDPRGTVSDGETTLIVSGVQASAGLVDLYYLMARSDWIETEAQLERFVPGKSSLMRRLAWKFRAAF